MPSFEGSVLRIYRLPIVVEAEDRDAARRKIEQIYAAMATDYDGSQDISCDQSLPASDWPVDQIDAESADEMHWSSWTI